MMVERALARTLLFARSANDPEHTVGEPVMGRGGSIRVPLLH